MTETSNLDRIKDLLNVWAHYYRPLPDRGFPRTCSFVVERVQTSRSTEQMVDTIPEDIKRLNDAIERMKPQFKRIISLEYFDKRPIKTKAATLTGVCGKAMKEQVYVQRRRFIYETLMWEMFAVEV